jgi:hypothetical protein
MQSRNFFNPIERLYKFHAFIINELIFSLLIEYFYAIFYFKSPILNSINSNLAKQVLVLILNHAYYILHLIYSDLVNE